MYNIILYLCIYRMHLECSDGRFKHLNDSEVTNKAVLKKDQEIKDLGLEFKLSLRMMLMLN